jgi:hypothetical protein
VLLHAVLQQLISVLHLQLLKHSEMGRSPRYLGVASLNLGYFRCACKVSNRPKDAARRSAAVEGAFEGDSWHIGLPTDGVL